MYKTAILRKVREQRVLHDVALELTYRCNLDCFFCYNDRDKIGKALSLDQYRDLLQDLARMQTLHLMLTGGEPMVHPYFFEIGRMASELGFVVRLRTNGHSLSAKMATRVREEIDPYMVQVSLHGATAEVHDRQTRVPGSFDRLVRNIGHAQNVGLRIKAISTPTAWNEHQIAEMFALCDSIGVPLSFQGPVAPRDNGDTAPLSIQPTSSAWKQVTRLKKERHDSANADSKLVNSTDQEVEQNCEESATCSVGVAGVDIDPYGNVQACIHLQESAGNLHNQSIEEIWNLSPLFTRARARAVDAARKFVDIPVRQFGAPVYCLAVEENYNKGTTSACGQHDA